MDLQRNIDIGIESSRAKRGANAIKRALDGIKRKSRSMADASSRDTARMRSGFAGLRGMIMSLATVFAGGSLVGSVKDFGQAVADLSAITGATGDDLEFLRSKAKEFGETTTLSSSQAAEAFRLIASAKPDLLDSVEALSQVTEQAIALAEATGDDLPTAADTLGSALNQFNAGAEESARFINVLAAGSKFGAATVRDMAEAMKFAGGIASNMAEISFEETNASLQLLSQFAIKGGEAGTQLRMILLALETQTNDALKPSVVGLNGALDNLAGLQMSAADAAKLFGSRNVNAANILIQQRDRVEDLTGKLTGSNVAYEQQATRVNTLQGDVLALKSAYEGLELTIGGAGVEGVLRQLTQAATENIRAISRNPLTTKIVQNTLQTTATAIADVKLLFQQLNDVVTTSGGGAAVYAGIWEGAIERIVRWTKYLWQQFVVGGPANLKLGITLMIAAFDRLRIGVTEYWMSAVSAIKLGTELLVANMVGAFELLGPNVQRVFQIVVNTVARAFDNMKLFLFEGVESIVGEIQQKIFDAAASLANLGFDERAEDLINVAKALGTVAGATQDVRDQVAQNERVRQAEIEAIDNTITMIKAARDGRIQAAKDAAITEVNLIMETAEAHRLGSQVAVQGAIAERDATLAALQALREKRDLLVAGAGGGGGEDSTPDAGDGGADSLIAGAEAAGEAFENLSQTGKDLTSGIADGFAEMAASGKASFADLAQSVIKDIIRMFIKSLMLKAISSMFGGAGIMQAAAPAGGAPVPGGQSGMDFKVGGTGGTDSKLVMFRATPGESVSVKTPKQSKDAGGGMVQLNQNLSIDARGADAARIEAQLPVWGERIRQQTLNDVVRMRDQGYLRK